MTLKVLNKKNDKNKEKVHRKSSIWWFGFFNPF